jgi:hypothetical protein
MKIKMESIEEKGKGDGNEQWKWKRNLTYTYIKTTTLTAKNVKKYQLSKPRLGFICKKGSIWSAVLIRSQKATDLNAKNKP